MALRTSQASNKITIGPLKPQNINRTSKDTHMRTEQRGRRRRGQCSSPTAISCIRILIILGVALQIIKITAISTVLFISRNETPENQLKIFLIGHMLLCAVGAITFFSKNRSFFQIRRIPEFEENNDISVFSNLVGGCNLFWLILGYHWIQECDLCDVKHPLLYNTTIVCIVLGILTCAAPLLAIVLLMVLIAWIKPALKTIVYRCDSDVPDGNTLCVICYEDYVPGCRVKFLPCNHHFHSSCINEWFAVRDSCPMCQRGTSIINDLLEPVDGDIEV